MNDKTKHTLVGFAFGLSALPITIVLNLIWGLTLSFSLATVVFIGKEIYDKYKPRPTGFDKVYISADYQGLFAGWFVAFFVFGLIKIIGG